MHCLPEYSCGFDPADIDMEQDNIFDSDEYIQMLIATGQVPDLEGWGNVTHYV